MQISDTDREPGDRVARDLLWTGVVTLLVGGKLMLSSLVPGLRTPGEQALSGILLLATTVGVFRARAVVVKRDPGD